MNWFVLLQATHPDDQIPLLNVNFPDRDKPLGIRTTRLGQRQYSEGVELRHDPRGNAYFWIGGPGGVHHPAMPGSDTEAVDAGYVSVSPLSLEATHPQHLGLAAYIVGPEEQDPDA